MIISSLSNFQNQQGIMHSTTAKFNFLYMYVFSFILFLLLFLRSVHVSIYVAAAASWAFWQVMQRQLRLRLEQVCWLRWPVQQAVETATATATITKQQQEKRLRRLTRVERNWLTIFWLLPMDKRDNNNSNTWWQAPFHFSIGLYDVPQFEINVIVLFTSSHLLPCSQIDSQTNRANWQTASLADHFIHVNNFISASWRVLWKRAQGRRGISQRKLLGNCRRDKSLATTLSLQPKSKAALCSELKPVKLIALQ